MHSRSYQNILHIVGILASITIISGAVLVGKGDTIYGIFIMIIGALFQRVSSEIEFQKMGALIEEKHDRSMAVPENNKK